MDPFCSKTVAKNFKPDEISDDGDSSSNDVDSDQDEDITESADADNYRFTDLICYCH